MQAVGIVAVVFGALENLIHAGIIFGWPSLVYVLKDIGYYSDKCHEDPTPTGASQWNDTSTGTKQGTISSSPTSATSDEVFCEEQDAALVLVYTVATVILPLSMLPAGYLLLITGSRISRIVFSLMMIVGYVCLALSSPEIPGLLYPAAILLGAAGLIIILASFEIANLFPTQKSTLIGVMNGCYDTSTLIFFLLKIAYENGVSLEISSLVLAISTIFFGVNIFILPRDHIPWPLPDDYYLRCVCSCEPHADKEKEIVLYPDESQLQSNCESRSVGTQTFEYDNLGFENVDVLKGKKRVSLSLKESSKDTSKHEWTKESTLGNPLDPINEKILAKRRESVHEHNAERIRDEAYPTFFSCLKSPMFFFMSFWAIVIQLQLLFVLGIMNPWLTWLADGDLDVVSQYTNVLALMSFVSLIGGPLGGLLLDRRKFNFCSSDKDEELTYGPYTDLRNSWIAVTATTLMSIAYSVCMLIRILPLQYLTFALLTLCRSMLYAVSAGVVPLTFPMRYYGIVYGMTYLLIGVCGFLQYPLFILIQNVLMDDPAYVLIGFIVANVLTFSYPAYIIYHVKKKMA